jgi:alpha-tubulin suppressor-like RCC1 family protein
VGRRCQFLLPSAKKLPEEQPTFPCTYSKQYALIRTQAGISEREFERIAYDTATGFWRANRSGAYSDTRGSAGSAPGNNYTLQMATNLAAPNWTALVTNSPTNGTFTLERFMKTKRNLIQIWLLCAAMLQAVTSGAQPVTKVAAGYLYSLFLKSDGSLWGMGANGGELGDGTYNNTNRPEQIASSNVTAIAAGGAHILFIKKDGSLWATGYDDYGQLGDGTYTTFPTYGTNRPEQIVASGVTAIAAGSEHSLFLKSDGSLWATGGNLFSQLGDGTNNSTNRPEQIVASGVTAIAAGSEHSLFLKNDGSLWAMGRNDCGQLGDGTYGGNSGYTNCPEQIVASGVTAIAGGELHSLFLKSDGSLWATGMNVWGELGDGTYNSTNRPEQIVASGVTAISGGYEHSLFIKSDGSLWAVGSNDDGQLGDGTNNQTNRPEQIVAGSRVPPPTATASAIVTNGFIIAATIIDGGFGYTNTPTVRIIGGGGSGAQAVAVVSNGVVIAVNILDTGSGYTNTPVIVIDPPFISNPVLGIAPMSFLSFSNLTVGGVYQLQQSVAWYWSNQPVSFTATNALYTQMVAGVAGSGDYRLALSPVPAQAFATAVVSYGYVVHATVTSGGSGYVTSPAVTIAGGGGTNATAVSQISGGVVTNITITSNGTGYTNTPTVRIAPPPAAAVLPMVLPVMRVDSTSLAPYDNYQIQFKPDLGRAWANWNGGLFSPTDLTNSQYLFITDSVGFFRLQYVP